MAGRDWILAGGDRLATLKDAPTGRVAGELELEVLNAGTGAVVRASSPAGIVERAPGYYVVSYPADVPAGTVLVERWTDLVDPTLDIPDDEVEVRDAPPPPAAGPYLASIEDLRLYLRTQGTVSAGAQIDERLLELVLSGASSRMIAAVPERTLLPLPLDDGDEPVELAFAVYGPQRVLQVPDLRELVNVTLDGATIDTGGATLMRRPRELCALWLRLRSPLVGRGELRILGRWGPAGLEPGAPLDVRADVRDACLVWASRAYHARASRFADNVADPSGATLGYFRNLPPDVKTVLESLTVPGL